MLRLKVSAEKILPHLEEEQMRAMLLHRDVC